MIMSVQAVSQTSIDGFSERVSRLFNRSQKLRDSMAQFGQRWGIDVHPDIGPTMTTVPEEVTSAYVEPVAESTQPIVEEPATVNINHDDIDLDSLIDGIKLDDDELSL